MSNKETPWIQFWGATQTVTGSKTLLNYNGKKILIDCGLFQGPKEMRILNWEEFPLAKEIDAVVLTHAHVDHCGYLPKLVKEGYRGPIYCSSGTLDLCQIILPDSAHLQEEDARFANESRHSHHAPSALPLYTLKDAEDALKLFVPLKSQEWIELFPQVSIRLLRSGHILGSTFVQFSLNVENQTKLIKFSGDIGNGRQNVIKGPVPLIETDYLVLEGTYGDRLQSREDPLDLLEECVNKVVKSSGVLVIPAFAVGRTQEILFLLRKLEKENRIPPIPIFLDSPMAIEATDIYLKHHQDLKLDFDKNGLIEPLCSQCFQAVRSTDESMLLCMKDGPMVVISAAGMLSGGRVLHHLKVRLPHSQNIVLFVGWQASQTKGRLLQQGFPKIRIHHQDIDVEAEIVSIDSLSAHGDTQDIMNWVKNIKRPPQKIFLNHGEEPALKALQYRLSHELGIKSVIPDYLDKFELK